MVPNSVTLDDLERRNSPNGCIISPNLVAFWADYVKVTEMQDKNVVFIDISLMVILAGDHPKRER